MERLVGGAKTITMSMADFKREHHELLDVLRNPTKEKLEREYAKQLAEMNKTLKGGVTTHKENVLEDLDLKDEGHSLDELAKASGISREVLQEVYNRGIGAYSTSPESVRMKGSYKKGIKAPMSQKLSKEQWAMARVYSFIDNNPKHDQDLRDGVEEQECEGSGEPPADLMMPEKLYLKKAKSKAKAAGYNPKMLMMADDGKHKLVYDGVKFGALGYGDHIIYKYLEKLGEVEKGLASKKRRVFRKSHGAMNDSGKFSANQFAINILW